MVMGSTLIRKLVTEEPDVDVINEVQNEDDVDLVEALKVSTTHCWDPQEF